MKVLAPSLLMSTALAILAGGAIPALAKTTASREADDPISAASRAAAHRSAVAKPTAARTTRPTADTIEDDDDNASPQLEAVHVVVPGETLGGVANRAHVPRVLIIEANGLKEPYALREGQRLRLPRTRHHTVAKGETGFDIAYHYGVPFSAIATEVAWQNCTAG